MIGIQSLIENALCVENHKIQWAENEKKILESSFKRMKVYKNEYLVRVNEIEKYIYFVEDGVFRYYICNKGCQEESFRFVLKGECINPDCSLTNDFPSLFNIQALCDSVIWCIHRDVLLDICKKMPKINMIKRTLAENLVRKQYKILLLRRLSPQDRYLVLVKEEKELIQQIPLKYIASYIGIAGPSLSRIRKRLS